MFECIIEIVHHINPDGCFSVTRWYKKGVVDDQSDKNSNVAADSGITSFHPVYIIPSDTDELNKEDDESEIPTNDDRNYVDLDKKY